MGLSGRPFQVVDVPRSGISGPMIIWGEIVICLYLEWLPQSEEELRDFTLYFQRVSFFPDVPEHEAITDVFLPLK
jgi:AraC family transcriptional regulator